MTLLPTPGFQHQDPEVGTTAGKPPVFQGPSTRHFRGNFNEGRLAFPHTRDLPQHVHIVCGFTTRVSMSMARLDLLSGLGSTRDG